ncbi:MAG: 3-hydroxyacyl-[acyl-carrier-protein] dehydratase FabZ [Bacteroidota bacterium]|jgi:3-hydroxyacyl-[acyl-carrier-protein] dehydratase
MRYQFIDKIKQIEIGKQIIIVKNVTITEDYFEEHFIGYPVMPGALQIETIVQACSALIEISSQYKLFSILLMVEKMKFRKMVHPGDQLVVTGTVLSQHSESALFDAKIEVDGKVVTAGQLMVGTFSVENSKYVGVMKALETHFNFLLQNAIIIDKKLDL